MEMSVSYQAMLHQAIKAAILAGKKF